MAAVKTPAPERAAGRKKLAKAKKALPDGSFPIPNVTYLGKAIRAVGRAAPGKRPALARLIRKRARQLGAPGMAKLKGSWADNTQSAKAMTQALYGQLVELGFSPEQSRVEVQATMPLMIVELVGPKGYVHGWKFVGIPGGGRARSTKTSSSNYRPRVGDHVRATHPSFGKVEGRITKVHSRQEGLPGSSFHATVDIPDQHGGTRTTSVLLRRGMVTHVKRTSNTVSASRTTPASVELADTISSSTDGPRVTTLASGSGDTKASKASVHYREATSTRKCCGTCVHFSNGSCELVSGTIKSDDICDKYSAKSGTSGYTNTTKRTVVLAGKSDPDNDGDNDASPSGDTDKDYAGKLNPLQRKAMKRMIAKGMDPKRAYTLACNIGMSKAS